MPTTDRVLQAPRPLFWDAVQKITGVFAGFWLLGWLTFALLDVTFLRDETAYAIRAILHRGNSLLLQTFMVEAVVTLCIAYFRQG